jgi:nucleotide-binding universal stress UspA family protein
MKRILLATDGSPYSEEAAWLLSHLPYPHRREIIVLTVLNIPYVNRNAPTAGLLTECVAREREAAEQHFESIREMFEGADVALTHVMREGPVAQTIVDVADGEDVDLVVVGARGRSTVQRILLGSTSDYVATHAPCSVLVVRPSGLRERTDPLKVLLGYEDAGPARAAIEEFAEIHWGPQTHVDIVTVVSFVSAFLNEIIVDADEAKRVATEAVEQAAKEILASAPHGEPHLIESDHIGEALVAFADQHHTDLIFVGETPHTALGRALLGSVSRYVLRHAKGSVWITRNRKISGTIAAESGKAEDTSTVEKD